MNHELIYSPAAVRDKVKRISMIVSLAINVVYSIVETIFIKTGKNMPIETVRYDGDCINVFGVYWHKLMLTPAMSIDDPNPGASIGYMGAII
ncbi:MAG: hypothetical protein J6N53_00545 [Lachnospiraceae bacterium]|nr:hypothetical protein [Lachnospiraceae bacterium]MBP3296758.1 hypothetical protein [Lachnospiraceae bacterium]